eukprot:SAG25_NODE_337_length_9543_cov_4.171961_5_plen_84_part_00
MAGTAGLRQREARLEQQASGFMNLEQASTEAKDTLLRVCSRLARVPALSGEEGNVSVTVSDHETSDHWCWLSEAFVGGLLGRG